MKRIFSLLLKLLKLCIIIITTMFLAVWFGGRWILSFSVAEYEGEIHVSDIHHPIEITFDAKGIPQIWAETDSDVLFAMGWLHASERLFQMELIRRMAAGELSEIFGDVMYEIDLFQRKIGVKRIAARGLNTIDSETLRFLEQYCRGINAWIEHKKILPPEFVLLRTVPKLWTPVDCLSIMVHQAWYVHEVMDEDSRYNELIEKFGDTLAQYMTEPIHWSPPTVQKSGVTSIFKYNRFPFRMTNASNSWVVSPHKSTTGAALHAADPHLEIYPIPGFWYVLGLHSKERFNFLGVTTPGLPFGVMGHTGVIAYAFSTGGVDIIDYYQYRRHPDDPLQILTENGYQPLTLIQEEIVVQGEEQSRKANLYMIDGKPVIEETNTDVVALQWAGFDFDVGKIMKSALTLMEARDFSEFRKAVTGLGALDANWTYSDIRGNIGYQLGTPVPKRNYSNSYQRLSGADSSTAWQGYYPLSDTPYVYNPEEGWIATCNNQIIPGDWPYKLPGVYDPYRIIRARILLSQREAYSPEDMRKMQMDIVSGIALQWKHLLASGAEQLGRHDLAQDITQWDGRISLESNVALLFTYWWEFLPRFLFEDDLGKEWRKGISIQDVVLTYQIQDIIDDRRTTDRIETLVDIAAITLENVLPMIKEKTISDISLFEMAHPLSEVKILDVWLRLNRGLFHLPGDYGTLNVNWKEYDEETGKFYTLVGPSMRFVLDWSDLDAFTIHTTSGQSGNPFSPHYDDFVDIWLKGDRWVVPFTKERVYPRKASLLTLIP